MPKMESLLCVRLPRREFLSLATGVAATCNGARCAGGHDAGTIRIGLIGCGGRGTGAAMQAAMADPAVRIVAMGDAFADQLASAADVLDGKVGMQFDCPPQNRFAGGDAYLRVVDQAVDAVLIAAPPHLRPLHVAAAVAAGVHVYCETPAAIDVEGVMRVAESLAAARRAGLSVASGLHSRRDDRVAGIVEGVRGGVLGDPLRVEAHVALGDPWRVPAQRTWTAGEVRVRNWISHEEMSGGWLVERHIHAIDRALWVLGDRLPIMVESIASGGRGCAGVRYVFADGAEIHVTASRTAAGAGGVREIVTGSLGSREIRTAPDGRRFQATMDGFVQAIRSGRAMSDADILVRSSLVAITGRSAMAAERPINLGESRFAGAPAFPVRKVGGGVNPVGV